MTLRHSTIANGNKTMIRATAIERSQSREYLARVLEARYFQAKTKVSTITGTTTISISHVAVMMMERSSIPICPSGSRTAQLQPPRNPVAPSGSNLNTRLGLEWAFIEYTSEQ